MVLVHKIHLSCGILCDTCAMKLVNPLVGAAVLIACLPCGSAAWAQHSPVSPEHELKVGDKAPDFELPSHQDRKVHLDELTKKGMVAIVFHRSADW